MPAAPNFSWNDLLPWLIFLGPVSLALLAWAGLALVAARTRLHEVEPAPLASSR